MKVILRVYGVMIVKDLGLLVSDEIIRGEFITKLPGGGLEPGEGLRDCLIRECMEEFGVAVRVDGHFYTTDFFQVSAFDPSHQIISIYYSISCDEPERIKVSSKKNDFTEIKDDAQSLRWVPLHDVTAETFTLPIDKVVGEMIKLKIMNLTL